MLVEIARNESGQGMLEYVLIISLVAVIVMVGIRALGLLLRSNYYDLFNNRFNGQGN